MVLIGSFLDHFVSCFVRVNVLSFFEFDADQFVSGFVRADVLSTFEFDAVGLMNFSTVFYSYFVLIQKIQDRKCILKFMMVLCRI